jgi:hypothetical protein
MDERWAQRIADRLRWAGVASAPGGPSAGVSVPPAPDTSDAVSSVLACPDPAEFVRRAYRLALSRDPNPGELANRVKRLKYFPFYTRERMLRRLLTSVEAELVRRAEQARATDTAHRLSAHLSAVLTQVASSEEWVAGSLAQLLRASERTASHLAALDQRLTAGGPPTAAAGGTACGS